MIITTTSTKLAHFHDFYFLQALEAAIMGEIAANPEMRYKRSVEKLQMDLQEYIDDFVPNLALRTFVYLYAACIGEARHAKSGVAKNRFLENTTNRSRHDIFANVSVFEPTQENLKALVSIFDQEWETGYGGAAWCSIAEALLDYGKIPDAAWIDHVVDLEHNNGTAFNKADAGDTIFFETDYPLGFSQFLDYKFQHDILSVGFRDGYDTEWQIGLTHKTLMLVLRFANIFRKPEPTHIAANQQTLTSYNVIWGDEKLVATEKWMEWISVSKKNEPSVETLRNKLRLNSVYPPNYTPKQLQKKAKKAVKIAKEFVPAKFMTKKLKKEISAYCKKWLARSLPLAKQEKLKVTYSTLPVKVVKKDAHVRLYFPVPFEGLGNPCEDGFYFDMTTTQIVANTSTWGAVQDGLVMVKYGEMILETEAGVYTLLNKKLEVLFD